MVFQRECDCRCDEWHRYVPSVQTTNLGTYFAKVGNLQSTKETVHVELTATQGILSDIYPAVEIVFPTTPGRTYLLQKSVDLTNWSSQGDPLLADGFSTAILVSSRGQFHTFYRVLQRLGNFTLASLNGITLNFKPITPSTARPYSIAFTGTKGALSGSYIASGGISDTGTFTYAVSGTAGTMVASTAGGGPSASYSLDFAQATYVKTQFGAVIETGTFSY